MIHLALTLATSLQNLLPTHDSLYPRPPNDMLFGSSVANLGDFDGDGLDDLYIGDPGEPGRAWVISSNSWKPVLTMKGLRSHPSLGESPAPMGDCNADGVPEILIRSERAWPWGVEIRSGKDGRQLVVIALSDCCASARLYCDIGDFDGDSIHDVFVSGSEELSLEPTKPFAKIYSGRTAEVLVSIPFVVEYEYVASSPCHIPDEDGDGRADWAFAARLRSKRDTAIQIVSSRDWKPIRQIERISGWSREGAMPSDMMHLGRGPELSTMLVSQWNHVGLVSTRDGTVRKEQPRLDTHFGAVRGLMLDDVNRDESQDYLVTFPGEGIAEGALRVYCGATGKDLSTITLKGTHWADAWHFGATVAVLSDVDGDGFRDFAAGVRHSVSRQPGAAFVFSGRTGAMLVDFKRDGDSVRAQRHEAPIGKAK